MIGQPAPLRFLIMDACVLIDFMKADRSVFRLIADRVGPIHVVNVVVEEVRQIESEEHLRELGIVLVEPTMEDAYAAAGMAGLVSFQDNLCMLTAKRHSFTCVTNDKNLRKCCTRERVRLLWGLELLVELYRAGGVSARRAVAIAQAIRASNPKHITAELLARFQELIQG